MIYISIADLIALRVKILFRLRLVFQTTSHPSLRGLLARDLHFLGMIQTAVGHHYDFEFVPGFEPRSPACKAMQHANHYTNGAHNGVPIKSIRKVRSENYLYTCNTVGLVICLACSRKSLKI